MTDENADKSRGALGKVLVSLSGTYALGTLCWVVCGLLTPGDYFANGSLVVLPSMAVAGAGGAYWGAKSKGRTSKFIILMLALAATAFWGFAPDGWWARPPPMPMRHG